MPSKPRCGAEESESRIESRGAGTMAELGAGIAVGLIALAIGIYAAANKIDDAVRYYVDNSR